MKRKKQRQPIKIKSFSRTDYINLIAVIIIPIVSIVATIYVAEKAYKVDKGTTPPVFFLKEEHSNGMNNPIKIYNVGGMVTYFRFRKITEIDFTLGERDLCLRISYKDKNDLYALAANVGEKNTWYFEQTSGEIEISKLREIFNDTLKKGNLDEYADSLTIRYYYTLGYYDFENNYHEYYYVLDDNGLGVYYDKGETTFDKYSVVGGMVAYHEDSSVLYDNFRQYIENEVDMHYKYQEWLLSHNMN